MVITLTVPLLYLIKKTPVPIAPSPITIFLKIYFPSNLPKNLNNFMICILTPLYRLSKTDVSFSGTLIIDLIKQSFPARAWYTP